MERPRLHALPEPPYDTDLVIPCVVSKEARVRLDANTYSVPPEYVGKTVHVRTDATTVRVLHEGTEVARRRIRLDHELEKLNRLVVLCV